MRQRGTRNDGRRHPFRLAPPLGATLLALAVAALGTACARGAGKGQDATQGSPAPTQSSANDEAETVPRALSSVPTSEKVVALTYDDGPGAGASGTPAVVALLKAARARATFFVLGEELRQRPEVVRAAAGAGMEIENHGDRHRNLAALAPGPLAADIARGADAIATETGRRPHFLRPPFGAQNARVRAAAHDLGERVVLWSVDTRDWTNPGSDVIVRRVLGQVAPGAIVLLHDGGSDRSQTVEATRQLLPALRARGYQMVTLARLIAIASTHPSAPEPRTDAAGRPP